MSGIVFDADKVNSYVLPTIAKSINEISSSFENCNKIKKSLPSSFKYRITIADTSTKLNEIKNELNTLKSKIEKNVETIRKNETKNESNINSLVRQLSQIGILKSNNTSTSSTKNSNVKSAVNVNTSKKESTGAKSTNGFSSFFKKLFNGIKNANSKISISFDSIFKKASEGIKNISNALDIFKNVASKLLISAGAKISTSSTLKKKEPTKDIKNVSNVSNVEKIEKNKSIYKNLSNTSNDDKKIFGADTTLGLNGDRIVFDKILKLKDGSMVYQKDGKTVKEIGKDYVKVGATTYYKDGAYCIGQKDTGEWNSIINYYNADGNLSKIVKKGMGSEEISYYNSSGLINKKESKSRGELYVTTYDSSGKEIEITKNGVLYIKYEGNKTIYYDDSGNAKSEVEKLDDKLITYNKKDNTKKIEYNNGIVENYDKDNKLKTSQDANGIKTEYTYLKNGEKISYIEKDQNGQSILTCYDKNGEIKSQTIGKCTGGGPGSDGETNIPILDGKTTNYRNGKVVSTFDKSDGITVGENYQEYIAFGTKYGHYENRIKELGLTYHFCQGVNTVRENYNSNGSLKNVTCTGQGNYNDGGKYYVTQVYYPDGKFSKTEKRYDVNGKFVNETYYMWDKNGKILEYR